MAEHSNFLIGYGERLASDMAAPASGGPKKHPYTFDQARRRLTPKITETIEAFDKLKPELCPNDQAVALVTLHPTYLAKSYYPGELLRTFGLETIGSRSREISPERWATQNPDESAISSELFVAGSRASFRKLANKMARFTESQPGAKDLIKIEDFRAPAPKEKVKPLRSKERDPLFEVVLHAQPLDSYAYIIEGFELYLRKLGIDPESDQRRFFAEGLCFMALRAPRDSVEDIAKFSFLRVAREMPRLRQFRPVVRATPGFTPFSCLLPKEGPIATDLRVAVFDGGVAKGARLDPWVSHKSAKNLGDAVPEFQNHGTAVTSALLFGPLQNGVTAERPYAKVDHYRVLDVDTKHDSQGQLYTVLDRIDSVLDSRPKYDFINLSLGPDMPIEDNEVHAWTAILDQHFSDGQTLSAIAVGNTGENEWSSGNARILPPADCVNALAVGSCDRIGESWKRAGYSSIGPGRSPGIIKPDGLAFGGSSSEPYWVVNAEQPGTAMPITGTSFAAPTALRTGIGLKAHFGKSLSPLAIKSLLLHRADDGGHDKAEVGWGRIPDNVNDIVLTDDHEAHIVYQGELRPKSWVRMPIPIPLATMQGMVDITATFCFASPTDPQDPLNYTRSGLEIRFRPHDQRRNKVDQEHPDTSPFFQAKDMSFEEADQRADAHKWETTLRKGRSMRGSGLRNPVFDVHYNVRIGGRDDHAAEKIPYALVITIVSKKTRNLYNNILQRYPTVLEPLRPIVEIPIHTSRS